MPPFLFRGRGRIPSQNVWINDIDVNSGWVYLYVDHDCIFILTMTLAPWVRAKCPFLRALGWQTRSIDVRLGFHWTLTASNISYLTVIFPGKSVALAFIFPISYSLGTPHRHYESHASHVNVMVWRSRFIGSRSDWAGQRSEWSVMVTGLVMWHR